MRHLNPRFKTILSVAFLVFPILLSAQTCLPLGITFSSQAQIDAFSTNYPGCTQILGDIVIDETLSGNILNLNGLSQLNSTGGSLFITSNAALTNLSGLNNITSVGGFLDISLNPSLNSLSGLDNLASVNNYLNISDNPVLPNLNGLGSLSLVGGSFYIVNNLTLSNISALINLVTIGERLQIATNPQLGSLSGLDNLTSIGDWLYIVNNELLTDLMGLGGLTAIGGDLYVSGNNSLISLAGIENIDPSTITDLFIFNNPLLFLCNVQSICNYLIIPLNPATISSNASNCASRFDVDLACSVLSVEWLDFSAYSAGREVVLEWRIQGEGDHPGFDIQRSGGEANWEWIGFESGVEDLKNDHLYKFTDRFPLSGPSYYRLKSVDLTGNISFSNVIRINTFSDQTVDIFPNPSRGEYEIRGMEKGVCTLVDGLGKQLRSFSFSNSRIDISDLPPGLYVCKLKSPNRLIVRKIIKM